MLIFSDCNMETWRGSDRAGTWYLDATHLSGNNHLHHYYTLIKRSFLSMEHLIRPIRIPLLPSSTPDEGIVIEPKIDEDLSVIFRKVETALAKFQGMSLYNIRCDIALCVYVHRTDGELVRTWVNLSDELVFYAHEEEPMPRAVLNFGHTLFHAINHRYFLDNSTLHALNQPLLERALRRWEAALGIINELEGPSAIYRYGLLPDHTATLWEQRRLNYELDDPHATFPLDEHLDDSPTYSLEKVKQDTWSLKKEAQSWPLEITAPLPIDAKARPLFLLQQSFEALDELLRPLHFQTALQSIAFESPKTKAPYAVDWGPIMSRVLADVSLSNSTSWVCSVALRIFAYAANGDLVYVWIDLGDELIFETGNNNTPPRLRLQLHHTLFQANDPVLHALNQPLLERALRRWEAALGSIFGIEHQYG